MKNKIKLIIDIIMTFLYIILMGYHITGNKVHEILGTTIFVLFIIHNILNYRWYKTIFKGKHDLRRNFHILINILLLLSMIGMIISGMMMSTTVFSFLNLRTTMFARELHMASTSWGFILIGIHLGLHLNVMLAKLNRKMKTSAFEYLYYLILVLIAGYGLYSFIKVQLWKDMFLINKFKFFDYNQSKIEFYLEHIAIIYFIALLIYVVFEIIRKLKNKKVKGE